jgi:alpha-glucosidase
MQWDSRPNASFSSGPGEPWLPLADDYTAVNVAAQWDDPASMLSLHHRLIALRRVEPALSVGSYMPIETSGDVLAYVRAAGDGDRRFLIALNLGPEPHTLDLARAGVSGRAVVGTHPDREGEVLSHALELRGDEGVVVVIEAGEQPRR